MAKAKGAPKSGGRKPGSRNKINAEIRALAQKHGPAAIDALARALDDPARAVHAASILLDRGYGKAPQPLTGEGGDGAIVVKILRLARD